MTQAGLCCSDALSMMVRGSPLSCHDPLSPAGCRRPVDACGADERSSPAACRSSRLITPRGNRVSTVSESVSFPPSVVCSAALRGPAASPGLASFTVS